MMVRLFAPLMILAAFAPISFAGDRMPPILRVATRELPTRFSPFGPLTDADRQAHDLIFEPLIAIHRDAEGTPHYHPGLAEAIPVGEGTRPTIRLRPDAKWSSGEPITVQDVRHSLAQMRKDPGAAFAWDALLDPAQLGASARELRLPLRHGLLQPLECFAFPIIPQTFQQREMTAKDDADFAKNPLGSGPFAFAGPTKAPDPPGLIFRKNPHHALAAKIPYGEIHWFAAADAKDLDKLKPDIALGFNEAELGGRNVKSALTRRVWYVAPNHRHPLLGQIDLRRFLGLSLQRDAIIGDSPRLSVNGLTPRDSWTQAPVPRVPDDLHQPEFARGHARELAKANKPIILTFKFPAEQSPKMAQVIDQWQAAAKAGGLELQIQPVPLSAAALANAVASHDFDLALVAEDHGDSIGRLMALFDPQPNALAPGGSNFLGVRDVALQQQVAALPRTRQFPLLRSQMQNLHVHLVQSMTVIPLWRHQAHYSLAPAARNLASDPLRPFADWR